MAGSFVGKWEGTVAWFLPPDSDIGCDFVLEVDTESSGSFQGRFFNSDGAELQMPVKQSSAQAINFSVLTEKGDTFMFDGELRNSCDPETKVMSGALRRPLPGDDDAQWIAITPPLPED